MGNSINIKKGLLIIVILASLIWLFTLDFEKANFNEESMLAGQWDVHFGMLETPVHLYVGMFHFLASLVAVYVIHIYFRGSRYGWKPTMVGIIFSGLIGFGEVAEHFFGPFGHDFFHYTHMMAAPLVLYYFYIGLKEYLDQFEGFGAASTKEIFIIFISFISLSAILASQAETPWDQRIEAPFIYVVFLPTLVLTYLLIRETKRAYFEHGIIMVNLPTLGIATTLLGIDILVGRYAHIAQNGWLYVMTHAFQDVLHAATGAIILLFAISTLTISKTFKKDLLVDWYEESFKARNK
ncbi:MAG: hypothetical protein HY929_09200 [Euryarchaeota archaeon]|nr:hypothetical protein [Euryarchaeota archaeon]